VLTVIIEIMKFVKLPWDFVSGEVCLGDFVKSRGPQGLVPKDQHWIRKSTLIDIIGIGTKIDITWHVSHGRRSWRRRT
jgi:hypothetical protein